jgi:leucyl-tRNA synthetase
MKRYNPTEIEPKWQKIWTETGVYTANLTSDKPKYIAMSMFNYPSGAGIHTGHAMNYTISDVKARFKRQQGYESYHPVGWDAFGLPAENYAIKAGVSPQESMATIIPSYHKQYKAMGWSNDWEKEIATHLPEYYKWTQWIFAQMYRHKLAYQDARMQWWCTKCQTVLANEQVIDGKCWRHDGPNDPMVQKKEVKQWFFKITEYADELLEATDALDWTESVKLAQKNWIGRSVGAEVDFALAKLGERSEEKGEREDKIKVFTTRPDTLFGTSFLVLAPEHPIIQKITTADQKEAVETYIKQAQAKTDIERQETEREKTGVFTGAYAINPANDQKIPIWVTDYVLYSYGTGAVMGSAAHDERDYAFAKKFDLPIINILNPVAIREDAKDKTDFIQKQKIVAVVQNDTGELLTINWGPNLGGRLFVGGTQEGDESPEVTAQREVAEETGYTDLEVIDVGQEVFYYKYFAFSKQEAHDVQARFVHLKLKSDAQQPQQLDDSEQDNFKVEWIDAKKAGKEIVEPLHQYAYEKFVLGQLYHGEGIIGNSGPYDGMDSAEMREKIVADLAKQGKAEEKVNYKMRDWSVSRQRYWGAPIPIVHCAKCGPVLVPDDDLPVVLPELTDFAPSGDGRSALARAKDWLGVDCPQCGSKGERETDTLDTYICSSWYMYRYFDPHNQAKIFDSNIVNKWAPIDFYNGGDHATAHLLYARFIVRFFNKIGLVNNPEPFKQMLFNGKVRANDGSAFSKTLGNGIDPLEVIDSGYGADALRMYLMFAAPLEFNARWDSQGVPGTHRFLSRLWNLLQEYVVANEAALDEPQQTKLLRATNQMVKKITEDIEDSHYNTAIATAMGTLNEFYKLKAESFGKNSTWQAALEAMVACVAPFAPHIADELWQQLGHSTSVHVDTWPKWDDKYLVEDTMTIAVQVNGKVRAQITVATDATKDAILEAAKADPKVATYLNDQTIKKEIYVPNKLVSLVI